MVLKSLRLICFPYLEVLLFLFFLFLFLSSFNFPLIFPHHPSFLSLMHLRRDDKIYRWIADGSKFM